MFGIKRNKSEAAADAANSTNSQSDLAIDVPALDIDKELLEKDIIAALKQIYDPEIPVNIYDMGLIYNIAIDDEANVNIDMTLTTPMCPVAQTFPQTVQQAIMQLPQIENVTVELVWDPPWDMNRMTEAAKLELGLL